MTEIKCLGDIKDMERYLAEDCYCPGEIYETNGIFCQTFNTATPCRLVLDIDDIKAVIVNEDKEFPRLIVIGYADDTIADTYIVDALEYNIALIRDNAKGLDCRGRYFKEYKPGDTEKRLQQVMSICDGIIID